ncbi:tyrosine-type recombinase/integrase [Flavobacterium dauae]|uniref:tyrosine-type recombinase/integrase n=1 Tax=Flavobacterium dauae TaxID=1563479 RepID=UPI00101B4551|nr:tyrosine-type recombinase/integrase [Flavobacterium dauae]WLD23692.1 tyrosine-type recombinase/integrase [Flavobacterium dauae]
MNEEWLNYLTFKETVHRNQKVILCHFQYNPQILSAFKKEFPSVKWSRTHKTWYVPNTTLFRKRLNLPLPGLGDNWLPKIYEYNKVEFIKFRNVLVQKMYSQNTINTYLSEFAQLLILLKNKPVSELTYERLNAYFLYCIKTLKHSEAQVYSRMNAIKAYFKYVLNEDAVFDKVIRPKPTKQLPKVFSKQEVLKLFAVTQNLKHLLILKMAYGMGLRVSELIVLKINHIDLDRMQVHIISSKGKKDRYVNFPESLVSLYLDYLKAYQPTSYLFQGQYSEQYAIRSAQAVFRNAINKAQINKKVGIHGLRHSYATHLLEAGTDMIFIQKLLGHNHIKTTEVYAKVSNKILSKVKSPLDDLKD